MCLQDVWLLLARPQHVVSLMCLEPFLALVTIGHQLSCVIGVQMTFKGAHRQEHGHFHYFKIDILKYNDFYYGVYF